MATAGGYRLIGSLTRSGVCLVRPGRRDPTDGDQERSVA